MVSTASNGLASPGSPSSRPHIELLLCTRQSNFYFLFLKVFFFFSSFSWTQLFFVPSVPASRALALIYYSISLSEISAFVPQWDNILHWRSEQIGSRRCGGIHSAAIDFISICPNCFRSLVWRALTLTSFAKQFIPYESKKKKTTRHIFIDEYSNIPLKFVHILAAMIISLWVHKTSLCRMQGTTCERTTKKSH